MTERPHVSATDATDMGRTAHRKLVSYGTGARRCNCGACNWLIDSYDAYCRRCGARFTGTDCRRAEYGVVDER